MNLNGSRFTPTRRLWRRLLTVVVGLVIVIGAIDGVARASTPDSNGVIHACYTTSSGSGDQPLGSVRIIDPATQMCRPNETAISWNQVGPPGPPGEPEIPDTVVVGTATIPGVTGNNPDGSFNIVAYSLGLTVDSTSTASPPTFSPLKLTKPVDSTDPTLFQLAATQAALSQVTVTIGSSSGQPRIVYTLNHAEITGDQLSDSGAQGAPDLDQLTISYESINVTTS